MINLQPRNNEAERLDALYLLEILDTDAEEEFENIVSLASIISSAPVSALTFVDKDRIWYKAKQGVECGQTARNDDSSRVYPFLVAVPVTVNQDLVIGHLSVASPVMMELSPEQHQGLILLSRQVVTLLQMRLPVINNSIKEFYESILNNIPTDLVVFDADHRYLFVNPWAIKSEECRKYIIGKDDFEYGAYRNRDPALAISRRAHFTKVKQSGKAHGWEESQTDADGNTVTYLRKMYPVHDEQGQLLMVIGFGIDITERKHLEEKQALIMEQIAVQNTQLIDFCNVVSHNLRGPLINMSMLAGFIREAEDVNEQKLLVSKLEPVMDNLKNIFNELIESIQIRQNSTVKSDHLNLSTCFQETLDGLFDEIKKARVEISFDFEEAPAIIYPHKYLTSIFYNLVTNAIKYQSPDRPLALNLSSRLKEGNIVLTVEDNGLGIDLDKHKDNIFKLGRVFHRHPDAKGLGLFMTKTQVEAMGGRIWVESCPDQGSTFSVEFVNQNMKG